MPFEREDGESEAVTVSFREFPLAFRLQQERQVSEPRHGVLPSERLVEQHMQWRRGEPFLTTYDVCDFHEVVVNDIGEVVGGQFVGTLVQHLVVEDVAFDMHLSSDDVIDNDISSRFDFESHHILLSVFDECIHLLFRHGEGVAHREARVCVVLEVGSVLTSCVQLLWRVESDIRLAVVEQHLYVFLVYLPAF